MLLRFAFALCLGLAGSLSSAAEMKVTIRTDHPGGNAIVTKNAGAEIEMAPDLRGNEKSWFYWNIAAEASQPGRVKFTFDTAGRIVARGPAVSLDDGKTWSWLGLEYVTYGKSAKGAEPAVRESFEYEFTKEHLKVRLAVAMPYQLHDLEAFLARQKNNPNLRREVLGRTTKGTFVPMVHIGTPGPNVAAIILTSRNHACESMASYVHEGFLEEASSDSPLAVEFRKRYALFSIPIVDVDGVEAGEQGKWRAPHDHNRDYGEVNLYPEVKAIQDLAAAQNVRYGFDLHCPAVRGDVHEAFYMDGVSLPHIKNNVDELINWLREERPQQTNAPLNFMKPLKGERAKSNMPMSYYFAYRPESVFGATLEVPYAQTGNPLDANMAREYGRALLRAWVRTRFTPTESDSRNGAAYADLITLRNEFGKLYRGNATAAEKLLTDAAQNAGPESPYRVEAVVQGAVIKLHQKQYAAARVLALAAANDPSATTAQRALALLQQVRIACLDPEAKAAEVEAAVKAFDASPYPPRERAAEVYAAAAEYYLQQKDYAAAIAYERRRLPVAADYQRGRVLNQIATLLDLQGDAAAAAKTRRESADYLLTKLDPLPISVFGAQMASDLFDAVVLLPNATPDEVKAAAAKVLEHKITPETTRVKVRAKLAELEKKS